MRFCGWCGQSLLRICARCQTEVPPGFRFCGQCGTVLDAPAVDGEGPAGAARPVVEPATTPPERRVLTVMFCDLQGSTELAEQLDPEELREVLRAYQAAVGQVIDRFGGFIAQYLGDGLLVYFGYPLAHEDDPRRAAHASLGILEAIRKLNERLKRERSLQVAVRIGIHTGLVVTGEIGAGPRRELLALGMTPNIASRLQSLADPNTAVLSEETYRLLEGYFICRSLGLRALKGITQPIHVYQLLGEHGEAGRFEVARRQGLPPPVGRNGEMSLLLQRFERARIGQGQVVLIMGEPGIGKSRLVHSLKQGLSSKSHSWWNSYCSPYAGHTALYPIADLLEWLFQIERNAPASEKLGKLGSGLESFGMPARSVPILAALLSLPIGEAYPTHGLTPQRLKEETLALVMELVLLEARRQPLVLVMEDLHWVDPSTLELLDTLVARALEVPLLLLLLARPTFIPPERWSPQVTRIAVDRLSDAEVELMVQRIAGEKALPREVLRELVTKADGVPLFAEELTRLVLESGQLREGEDRYEFIDGPAALEIPANLQGSLMARLDRLSPVKELVHLGAVIGREFSYELIRAVSPLDEETLQRSLAQLVAAELLFERGTPPGTSYVFKHALICDAAYNSLLRSTRQKYHQQIAAVLSERFPQLAEAHPELLAYHHTEANQLEAAVHYRLHAGRRALERSANLEALHELTQGLRALASLPSSQERDRRELELQAALGPALLATKGYAAPEVEKVYERAHELCEQLGDTLQLFWALWGRSVLYTARGDLLKAQEFCSQILRPAEERQETMMRIEAHNMMGAICFGRGELQEAHQHLESCLSLHSPDRERSTLLITGQDAGVVARSLLALCLWQLGSPEQALAHGRTALNLARELAHPHTLVVTLYYVGWLHQLLEEPAVVLRIGEELSARSREHGFRLWESAGNVLLGWALVSESSGERESGIRRLREALADHSDRGIEFLLSYHRAQLGALLLRCDRRQEAALILEQGLLIARRNGERFWEAELLRLQGETRMFPDGLGSKEPASDLEEAERLFLQALDVSRHQGAKSLALRAAMSLGQLWRCQRRNAEARALLGDIYGNFTEGLGSALLRRAKALLDTW